jgi:hypothetical protein
MTILSSGIPVVLVGGLPPTVGGATSAEQVIGNASLASIDGKVSTSAKQDTGNVLLASIDGKVTACNTGAVVVSSSALPTGAATEAKQDTGNTSLASILAGTPSVGPKLPSASAPIAMPLGLTPTLTGSAPYTTQNTNLLTGNVGTSDWYDANGFRSGSILLVGNTTITAGAVFFEQTNDVADTTGVPMYAEEITSLTPTPQIAAFNITSAQRRVFAFKIVCRYARVRISAAFTGAATGVTPTSFLSQLDYSRMVQTVAQATAANLATTVSGTVTASGCVGPAAHDAAISGNPLRGAARALTANYTAVASGDVADHTATLVGAQIIKQFSIPEAEFIGIDDITASTTAKQIKNATASNQNYVTGLSLGSDTLGAAGYIQLRSTPVASTTATIASNTLVMAATYNWKVGDMVYVTVSTVTGLSAGSYYYILTVSAANLTFSATRGGSTLAISGTGVAATLGKILFRHKLQTTSLPLTSVCFNDPIGAGTNLAIEMCTPTSLSSGVVDFNVHGYVAP